MRARLGWFACAVAALAVGACGGGNSSTGGAAGPPAPGPSVVPDKDCPRDFVIDDTEDNNNQVIIQKGRNGYWYTFVDKGGTTITPPSQSTFIMSAGGAGGSQHAAHMMGKVAGSGAPLFAGMGFSFSDPKGAYDASAFTGVAFYAKVGPGSTANVRLKVPDVNTDPVGKVCTECFNDFGADLTLTSEWKRYTVPFATMKQMDGWGAPHPVNIDKSKLYGLQWQVTETRATYDVWVDNVQFTGCP
jgi:endoglucanase